MEVMTERRRRREEGKGGRRGQTKKGSTGGKVKEREEKLERAGKSRTLMNPYTESQELPGDPQEHKAEALLELNVTFHMLSIFLLLDISDY